jgi:hypothetical protein
MTVRPADLRFLLPHAPTSVVLLGEARHGADAFEQLGISVSTSVHRGRPDAAFTDHRHLPKALASHTETVVITGWPASAVRLRRAGWNVRRYISQSGGSAPKLVATDDHDVRRFLASVWSQPTARLGRLRNALLASPAGTVGAAITVSSKSSVIPYCLRAAAHAARQDLPHGWYLHFGEGDDIQRVVAGAFPADADRPAWLAKFSRHDRTPSRAPVEDAVIGDLAARAPHLAAHVPARIAVADLDGVEAIVEQAVFGTKLTTCLHVLPPGLAHQLCDQIVEWILGVGHCTAAAAETRRRHLPAMLAALDGDVAQLVDRLDRVPVVLTHNDLGSWNIVSDGTTFSVVDWEKGTAAGYPLWDLTYFATDVLAELHGPRAHIERPAWCRKLWRMELPASEQLRAWTARAVASLHIPPASVPAVLRANWLYHADSSRRRSAYLTEGDTAKAVYLASFAADWRDPSFPGPDWAALVGR